MPPNQTSKKSGVVVSLAAVAVIAAAVVVVPKIADHPQVIGGQRDAHGCLVAAGYSYDDTVGACIRAFDMTAGIKTAAALAVAYVGKSYALTVSSFNSYEEPGAYDIFFEKGTERTPETVFVRNGAVVDTSLTAKRAEALLGQKLNIDASTVIATIDADLGLFAKGQVHFTEELGGGIWFAAYTKNGWEIAYSGNGVMPCSIADQYGFPPALVPQCRADAVPHDLIPR